MLGPCAVAANRGLFGSITGSMSYRIAWRSPRSRDSCRFSRTASTVTKRNAPGRRRGAYLPRRAPLGDDVAPRRDGRRATTGDGEPWLPTRQNTMALPIGGVGPGFCHAARRKRLPRPRRSTRDTFFVLMRQTRPNQTSALWRGRGPLFLEHRVDCGLGTFFAVGAGYAHRANHLAVDHDRQSSRLRKVVHESRCQILAGAHDPVHF